MKRRDYSFPRYLAAKKSVDDRALNRHVFQVLSESLPGSSPERPLKILEIGAGIGTMIERMVDWGTVNSIEYTAIDAESENIAVARQRLSEWGKWNDYQILEKRSEFHLKRDQSDVLVKLLGVDLFDFLEMNQGRGSWDLLVAHAFLDLVDVPRVLPRIFRLARKGGMFYFSINYDGLTVLQPEVETGFDEWVLELYHRTMEERLQDGIQFGDRYVGRQLFQHIPGAGGRILASGSSDWVVHPESEGYHLDEAHFLHFIIDTIYKALENHAELDNSQFTNWIRQRHDQIDRQELVYIAHQLDFFGICSGI